jgi:hypothetical protein
MKGGDMFSYDGCQNKPGPNGTWGPLGCDMKNVFTGIGHTFVNGFAAMGDVITLGQIAVD